MIRELEKSWKTSRFLTGKTRREVVSGRGWSNNFDSRHTGFKMPQTRPVRDAIQSGERCRTCAMRHTSFFFNQTDVLLLRDSTQYVTIVSLSQCYAVLSHFCHVWLCVTLWSAACQAPQSMEFFQAKILEWVAMPFSRGSSQSEWSESLSVVPDSFQSHGQDSHGILQARILDWVAFHFSRGSSQPRDWTQVSHIAGRFFTSWATREAQPRDQIYLSYISLWKLGSLPLAPPEKPSSVSAAAARLLQSCLTLCDPIDGSLPGSPVPGILQARTLEWGAISFSNAWKWKVKVKLLSRVRLFATPWTAVHQDPLFMGFSRQEYWSGVPLLLKCFPIFPFFLANANPFHLLSFQLKNFLLH